MLFIMEYKSHPVWVRGLKLFRCKSGLTSNVSHPVWVRGLKRFERLHFYKPKRSHPVWVRGLKPNIAFILSTAFVAPRVGAWIETPLR